MKLNQSVKHLKFKICARGFGFPNPLSYIYRVNDDNDGKRSNFNDGYGVDVVELLPNARKRKDFRVNIWRSEKSFVYLPRSVS